MRRSRKGQAMLETAFVLLIQVMIVVGILDLGQFLFFHQMISERARTGVRWAVVHTYDPDTIRNVVVYNSTSSQASGLFGLTAAMVTVTPLPSSSNIQFIQVQIDYPMYLFTPGLARSS